jgi:L-galactose dehydrogenase
VNIVKLAIQYCCANPDIATTLVGTARPTEILENIASANEPLDPTLLAEVLEILKPIHNHNFTRGFTHHRDLIIGA